MSAMHRRFKFAVVGCGSIGTRHVALLRQEPRAEVVALCDSRRERAEALTAGHEGVEVFSDFGALVARSNIDIIDICTPHALHARMAIEAARHRRHVLVEKPMALTVRDAQQMIDTADNYGVQLMVVKQNRYNVPVRLAKEALDNGWLGRVYMVQCTVAWNRHEAYYRESDWRGSASQEGGALYTQVSHFLDLLIWWFGAVVQSEAVVETHKHDIEIEDCGAAAVRFSTGVVGSLLWTTCVHGQNYEGSIVIIGERGTIKIGGQYLNKIECWTVEGHPLPEGIVFDDQPNQYGNYQGASSNHARVLADVIAHLESGSGGIVSGDEAIKTVEAIVSIYTAAGRQQTVRREAVLS